VPTGDGATPLTPDERAELVASWVRTRGDLNRAEAEPIAAVQRNYARRVPALEVLLDDLWLKQLHKRMFAGVGMGRQVPHQRAQHRRRCPPGRRLHARPRRRRGGVFRSDEGPVAATTRFHHRLVWVHPFPNGNGRYARMAADLCRRSLDRPALTWGRNLRLPATEVRRRYIDALRAGDAGDITPLVAFATT
jgi:fido (protein-threonine AMPylation protein)